MKPINRSTLTLIKVTPPPILQYLIDLIYFYDTMLRHHAFLGFLAEAARGRWTQRARMRSYALNQPTRLCPQALTPLDGQS
jgi:hypothetical protein